MMWNISRVVTFLSNSFLSWLVANWNANNTQEMFAPQARRRKNKKKGLTALLIVVVDPVVVKKVKQRGLKLLVIVKILKMLVNPGLEDVNYPESRGNNLGLVKLIELGL